MAGGPGFYSAMVRWLKILLPLVATGLLAMLFFVQGDDSFDGRGLTFSTEDQQDLDQGLRLSNPQLSGPTSTGGRYLFEASTVEPDAAQPSLMIAHDLSGKLERADGSNTVFSAARGVMDQSRGTVTLEDGFRLETSGGYRAEALWLEADLSKDVITARGPITAKGPLGEITAGGLEITNSGQEANRVITFTGGVRLIHRPTSDGK